MQTWVINHAQVLCFFGTLGGLQKQPLEEKLRKFAEELLCEGRDTHLAARPLTH